MNSITSTEVPTRITIITPTGSDTDKPVTAVNPLNSETTRIIVITPTGSDIDKPVTAVIPFNSAITPIIFTYDLPLLTTIYTQAPECSTRWILMSTLGVTSITSGHYAADNALGDGMDNMYWRSCYARETVPTYSPGMCFGGQTPALILEGTIAPLTTGKPQTRWQALCCPR